MHEAKLVREYIIDSASLVVLFSINSTRPWPRDNDVTILRGKLVKAHALLKGRAIRPTYQLGFTLSPSFSVEHLGVCQGS